MNSQPPPKSEQHDPVDLGRVDVSHGATSDRFVRETLIRQQTLQLAAELLQSRLLRGRLRLTSLAGSDSPQLERGAKSFGKLRRVDHRVEQLRVTALGFFTTEARRHGDTEMTDGAP